MKLESITVENYRQFEKAELTFDEGITILAGANNSGKTSLINLIKNIFVDDKLNYNMSDIPAKNMREWVEWVYPIFQKFFRDRKTEENVEKDLLNVVIPKEETDSTHLMKMTTVKIHVSYNPDMDDIKLFADCIMDLDETKHDFYFMYNFEIVHTQFAREIINNFSKIKHRFAEIEEKKSQYAETTDELIINNIQVKERYLKQLIVSLYIQATIPNVYFCDEDYKNKCKFDETKKFRQLFNFCFIKASRPLDDDESDHSHMLSKQMIKMVKMDEKWNELVESLPDEVLKPIQEKEIDKAIRSTSLESLKDTIATLEQTNGGKSGELMLDMQISEEDISDLLQRITTATYDIDGYYLGESSQGLGYSNMIYIHLQLKEYEKNIDPLKVNMFFLEEPESHMHPQMQQVFIKYLLDYYESKLQGLITTHSNEMVRVAGISHLRVIRHVGNFKSELYDLSILVKDLKKSEEMEDKELANFFDWFFEIGYSEIVFADRAIFYEGDTERLYIRKVMTLEKYKKLKQQYVAFIQVGGAYAKNYEKLIKLLGIKSLIITDIDYGKSEIVIEDVKKSKTTNATIEYFYSINNSTDTPTVEELYSWKETGGNIIEDLIYVCFQTKDDGYARTLEEAMINKYFDMDVSKCYKKSDWKEKRKDSELKFSIPRMKNKKEIADDDMVSVRDILAATSGNKTDFMCSVIMKDYVIGAGNLYDAYNKMEKYQFWKKYSAVDVMTKDEARINDALLSFLFIVDQIIEYYLQECYGEVFRNIHEYYMYFNSEKYIVEKHRDKKTIKTRLEKIKNSYVDRATTIDGFLNICFKEEFIEEEIYCSIIEDDDYQLVKDVYIEEVRKLTNYLNDPRVSTQHGVKGESHDTVVFVADNSSNPAVHMSKFFEVWSEMNITLREFDAFYYRYSNMIKDIECTMGIKISELKAKSYAAVADMIDTVLKRFISENENNPYYIFLLKPKMEKYKKKKNVTSAKACLNEGTVYGPLCAYRLFYVGCSRARKNLLIIINREDVKNFEDKLYEKLKDCGFEVEY